MIGNDKDNIESDSFKVDTTNYSFEFSEDPIS